MLEISPQGPSGLSGKICLCGIGAAGTKVMEEVLLLAPQSASVCAMNLDARLLNASSVPCKIHLGARLVKASLPFSVRWKAARWPSLPPGWEGERDPA